MAWYNNSWLYRTKITVQSSKVGSTDQTNFPVYIDLSNLPAAFFTHVKTDGSDLRITTSDQVTECPLEVVAIDTAAKTGELHFKAPTLSHTTNTDFYIYYGNTNASAYATNATFGAQNVWRSEFGGVFHMLDGADSSHINDSTANANTGTKTTAGNPAQTNAKIGKGQTTGLSDLINVGQATPISFDTGEFAVFAYVKSSTASPGNANFGGNLQNSGNFDGWKFGSHGGSNLLSGAIRTGAVDFAAENNINLGDQLWHRVVLKRTASGIFIYDNGTQNASNTNSSVQANINTSNDTALGCARVGVANAGDGGGWPGDMDEVRLWKGTAPSDDWITSDYNNFNSPSTFYSLGTEENVPASAGSSATGTILTFGAHNIGKTSAVVDIESNSSDAGASISERGVVYSTSQSPTTSDNKSVIPTTQGTTGRVVVPLTNLTANTQYFARGYIILGGVTIYGNTVTFKTASVSVLKHYYYKVFNATTGREITRWTKEVISEPNITMNINSAAGPLTIQLGRKWSSFGENQDVTLNNKIECWCVEEDNHDGVLLYSGYISGYKPFIQERQEYVEITVFNFAAEFARIILRDSAGNTTIAYSNMDPADILKDVINKYRANGGMINYSTTSIQKTNTLVTYTFNTNTIKECIDAIISMCPDGWFWRVDPDNNIYLRPKNTLADHTFTIGLNVSKLQTFRRVEDLVNRVLVVGGGTPQLFKQYDNTGSQSQYGLYTFLYTDQRITDSATAAIIANKIINGKKDPEIRSIYEIPDNNGQSQKLGYNIEKIKIGDTLLISNLKSGIRTYTLYDSAIWDLSPWDQSLTQAAADVIQIIAITYTPDSVTLEASSRLPLISQRIEQVASQFANSITVNNPTAPS